MNAIATLRSMYPHVKPHQLVFVNIRDTEGYWFVGECMSFPTPNENGPETALVRCVPGMASTAREFPAQMLDVIEPEKASTLRYIHFAEVAGTGSFPVDMLRYDCCALVNFKLVDDHWGNKTKAQLEEGYEKMIVARISERAHPHWTMDRWSSFLWGCRELTTEEFRGQQ